MSKVILKPVCPGENFQPGENIKYYPGALAEGFRNVLDETTFKGLNIKKITKLFPFLNNIVMVRHLESKYNEYKNDIKNTEMYKNFILASDPEEKLLWANKLRDHFLDNIGLDYSTGVSAAGHAHGESISKLYAALIDENPKLFPEMIIVSPYKRTRITTHYLLKNVEGLKLDVDELIDESSYKDLWIGSFKGKQVILKFSDEIRERDHGNDIAPTFLRSFYDSLDPKLAGLNRLSEKELDMVHYYNSPNGGESQQMVAQRIKHFLRSIMSDTHEQMLIVTHHLAILAAVVNLFSGTHRTFYNFDNNYKPLNGSLTLLGKVDVTESGQHNKLRVGAYNTLLSEI